MVADGARGRGDGGLLPRARARPRRGLPLRRRGLHEPDARPPRLPRRHGGLLPGQEAALRAAQARGLRRSSTRTTPSARRLLAEVAPPVASFSPSGADADVPRGAIGRCDLSGTSPSSSRIAGGRLAVASPLLGRFNVANLLGAAAGGPAPRHAARRTSRRRSPTVDNVPGRLERVEAGQPYAILVDYAHTPDALERLLAGRARADRQEDPPRLRLRRRPRPRQARADGRDRRAPGRHRRSPPPTTRAPRTRRRSSRDVEAGLVGVGRDEVPEDRGPAARRSARRSSSPIPGTVVVIAGKGHETTQVIGAREIPFDDRKVAAEFAGRA